MSNFHLHTFFFITQEAEAQSDSFKHITGKLEDLNVLLSKTQKKIDTFKVRYLPYYNFFLFILHIFSYGHRLAVDRSRP